MNPHFEGQSFHNRIAETLEAAERRDIRNLMICLPPRHGKTMLCSNNFPAWVLGRNPRAKIILASYSAELASRNSRLARNLFEEAAWPFPDVRVARDSSAAVRWGTEQGGEVLAAGVGGGITGFGADFLLIDDPFKGREEADSPREQERVWNWYREDASTRGMPKMVTLLIMTRWSQGDLAGRILNEDGAMNEWTLLEFPAICEKENDGTGREIGEALDPNRYPVSELERIKRTVGPRGWEALYQQHPTHQKGITFEADWWQDYDLDKLTRMGLRARGIFLDSAYGGKDSDYSVAAVWGTYNGRYYLMDLWRDRVNYPTLRQRVTELYDKWKCPVYVEDTGSGKALLQELRQGGSMGLASPAVPTIPFKFPDNARASGRLKSKADRAALVTDPISGGLVFLPERAKFVEQFLIEHTDFPTGRHDDIVDTTVMALMQLSGSREEAMSIYGTTADLRYR